MFLPLCLLWSGLCFSQDGPAVPEENKTERSPGKDTIQIYNVAQQMPQFPGGDAEMLKYIRDNINYSSLFLDSHDLLSIVTVRFAVMIDGSISRISIIKSPDKLLSEEAVRVIESMPKWIPGMQDGKPVNIYYHVPVIFRHYY